MGWDSFYPGTVIDDADPLGLGRVRISVGALGKDVPTEWAMPGTAFAGPGSGWFMPPVIGAKVNVMFLMGDVDVPVYIGGFWSAPGGESEVPTVFQRLTPTNKGYVSPTGLSLEFDDDEATQGIRLTSSKLFKINLNDADENVFIETPGGQKILFDDLNGLLEIIATGDMNVTVSGAYTKNVDSFTLNANADVEILSNANAKLAGVAGTEVGDSGSMTMVNGTQVMIAGGGAAVAVVGGKALGIGNLGGQVISTIVQGSSKVFAPL